MRRDVTTLRTFYAGALGRAAIDMVERKLVEAWGDARGLDVLGVGYATPFLEPFNALARRVVAAMPAGQGVEAWPLGDPNLACLAGDLSLPFQNALFDRIALVHALEESEDPTALLKEVRRVLAPSRAADRRGGQPARLVGAERDHAVRLRPALLAQPAGGGGAGRRA